MPLKAWLIRNSKLPINSRAKGKRGELEARDAVREHWSAPDCIRAAQGAGAYAADLLHAGHEIHVEIKCVAKIGTEKFILQAERDAAEGELPIVVMRQNRGEWCVMFRLKDSIRFADMIVANRKKILE